MELSFDRSIAGTLSPRQPMRAKHSKPPTNRVPLSVVNSVRRRFFLPSHLGVKLLARAKARGCYSGPSVFQDPLGSGCYRTPSTGQPSCYAAALSEHRAVQAPRLRSTTTRPYDSFLVGEQHHWVGRFAPGVPGSRRLWTRCDGNRHLPGQAPPKRDARPRPGSRQARRTP